MRATATCCLALLLVSVSQPAETQDATVDARRSFQQGERFFADGQFARALAGFRRAFELSPHDAVRFNIAVCYEELGRIQEAVAEYETAAESGQLDEPTRARARELAAGARSKLATLAFVGAPEGALITLGSGRSCRLPCQLEVDPRGIRVQASHEGYATFERPIDPSVGQRMEVAIALERSPSLPVPSRPESEPSAPPLQTPSTERRGVTVWTPIGASILAVGLSGVVGFGVRASSIHDDCDPFCASRSDADAGQRAQNVTNAAIGVAAAGAVIVLVDLILARRRTPSTDLTVRF
ncbi:MAG: tetratricopeptide repeat protein [Myxococcota bacterium]